MSTPHRQLSNEFIQFVEHFVSSNNAYRYDVEQNDVTRSIAVIVMYLDHGYRDIFYAFFSEQKVKTYIILNGARCELSSNFVQNITGSDLQQKFNFWNSGVTKRDALYRILKNQVDIYFLENPEYENMMSIEIRPNESCGFFQYSYDLVKNNNRVMNVSLTDQTFVLCRESEDDLIFQDPIVIQDQLHKL
jgi:hypothetical protein